MFDRVCSGCAAKDAEIGRLEARNQMLLDKILLMAGFVPGAETLDTTKPDAADDKDPEPPEDEMAKAEELLHALAEKRGLDKREFADA